MGHRIPRYPEIHAISRKTNGLSVGLHGHDPCQKRPAYRKRLLADVGGKRAIGEKIFFLKKKCCSIQLKVLSLSKRIENLSSINPLFNIHTNLQFL